MENKITEEMKKNGLFLTFSPNPRLHWVNRVHLKTKNCHQNDWIKEHIQLKASNYTIETCVIAIISKYTLPCALLLL